MTEAVEAIEEYRFPVSAAQERLLVLDRMTPGSAQYSVYAAFTVDGPFDATVFEHCVGILVERHEALRTVFHVVDGQFVQVVRPAATGAAVGVVRILRGVPAEAADILVAADAARPLDLARGPLVRVLVVEVEDGTHRIVLTTHHLVVDGWSLNLILRELSACYRELRAGSVPDPPDPGLHYADCAVWQREQAAAGAFDSQVAYWREALKDAPAVLPLPTDLPRPRVRGPAGGHHLVEIPPATVAALDRIAGERGVTPATAWFAAFAVFLGRLCERSDVVVGTPAAGRARPELRDVVGMFVNTLALRLDLSGDPTFHEVLARTHEAFLGAQANQDAPFDAVVDALAPARSLDHDPVYQVVFSLEDADALRLALDGAQVRRLDLFLDVAKVDFMAQAERSGTGLSVRFVYRSELYSPETIERWAGLLRTLLGGLVANDGRRRIGMAHWLTDEERDRLVALATGPRRQVADLTVSQLIERQARRRPRARAIVTRDEVVSYRELDERASHIAGFLAARGLGTGSVVGLCLPRGAAMPIAVLGVLKAAAAYVPLDPDYPADRLAFLLADVHADLVLVAPGTDPAFAGEVPAASVADAERGEPLPAAHRGAVPRDLAYIIHTSGSTGRPKGVAIEHHSLADYVATRQEAFGLTESDRVAALSAFTFDVSVSDLFLTLSAGAELHLFGAAERLGAPLADRLREARISWAMMVPSMLSSLPHGPGQLPDLRAVLVGGEHLPAASVERWAAGRAFYNCFGPTETTIAVTAADLAPGDAPVIGRPLPNTRVYVLDDRLEPSPVGIVGEIHLAGPGLARGYVGRPALTAERFVADRFGAPGERMYRSGDLGRYLPSGALDILGRTDDQVKIRGYRIEPGEIESALAAHPAVDRAVVTAHDDGGGDRRLVAYVVAQPGEALPDARLRAWLAEHLPAHMVPAVFVALDEIPVTASGKVDKAALPAPPGARPDLVRAYTAPRNGLERRIAAVWAQVLRIDRVGVDDGFFDLGGTSVRLLEVQNRLAEPVAGAEPLIVDLVTMFRHPTVAALAACLSGQAPAPRPCGAESTGAVGRGADRRRRLDVMRRPRAIGAPDTSDGKDQQ